MSVGCLLYAGVKPKGTLKKSVFRGDFGIFLTRKILSRILLNTERIFIEIKRYFLFSLTNYSKGGFLSAYKF